MKLKVNAKLDPKFQPLSIVCREMREATKENGQDIVIAVERNKGYTTTYKTRIYADGTGHDEENFRFVERIAKSLLWVAGGYKIIIAGSETIGNKIKEIRKKKGISQYKLAELSGISRATLSQLENGAQIDIRISTLMALARALNCSPSKLFK